MKEPEMFLLTLLLYVPERKDSEQGAECDLSVYTESGLKQITLR